MRTWWLVGLAGCGAPTVLPAPAPVVDVVVIAPDAAPLDAAPPRLRVSEAFGPVLDARERWSPELQDHELTITTATLRITIPDADLAHVQVAGLDDALSVTSDDQTWRADYEDGGIIAGDLVDGAVTNPVEVARGFHSIRFVAGEGDVRTIVLAGFGRRWRIVRSTDGGAHWTTQRLQVTEWPIRTSRASLDVVTTDGDWVRVHRGGDLTTIPIDEVDPDWGSCAATNLWIKTGTYVRWFADGPHGDVDVEAAGPLICARERALVHTSSGDVTRCSYTGCGAPEPAGDFADLTSDGVATATQVGRTVTITRTGAAPVSGELDDGERVVGMAVWDDVPTLVVLGVSGRLHLAAI